MIGGMLSSTVLTLVVIPAVYSLWKERALSSARVRDAVVAEVGA
jgi:Cu(I)/Ag(I) efflux system membrane protein CusA/SilA